MAGPVGDGGFDREELRLAVAMVGGSSLCVYIGGVARELRRLARASDRKARDRGVYGDLLDLTRTDVRIDVITGTSAGGLNGACLALAQTRGADLAGLRGLWLDKGDFSKLLRPMGDAAPPSLLRGDEYFLTSLREALQSLHDHPVDTPAPGPLHLQLTIVSMAGVPRVHLDDFGTVIHTVDHLASCTFERPAALPEGVDLDEALRALLAPPRDDFAGDGVPGRLALAARSSASFPVAFEPSLIPTREKDADEEHPDMAGIASLRDSGYVLDGGVLMNQPVQPALRAIYDMAADSQVRRVLTFVVPHPSEAPARTAPEKEAPPASEVLVQTLVTLPRNQSLSAELDQLRVHNRRVHARRAERIDLLDVLGDQPGVDLLGVADELWPMYRAAHGRRLAAWIVDEVQRGIAAATAHAGGAGAATTWDSHLVSDAVTGALADWDLPTENLLRSDAAVAAGPDWRWDLSAIDRIGAIVLDLLKRAVWLLGLRDEPGGRLPTDQAAALREIQRRRGQVHAHLAVVRVLRTIDRGYWGGQAATLLTALRSSDAPGAVAAWAREAVAGWPGEPPTEARPGAPRPSRWVDEPLRARRALQARMSTDDAEPAGLAGSFRAELAAQALALAGAVHAIVPALQDASGRSPCSAAVDELLARAPRTRPDEQARTRKFAHLLAVLTAGAHDRDTLRQLLALQVIQQVTGSEDVLEQPIELVQIDADVPSPFPDVPSGWRKLGGAKLGHFGAFYKRSWSANDWMWGRLDGAARLAEVALNPARLLQLGHTCTSALREVRRLAVPRATSRPGDVDYLTTQWQNDLLAITTELCFLDDRSKPLPARLPACAAAVARRLQIEILREELPVVAAAARADRDAGAAATPATSALIGMFGSNDTADVSAARLVQALGSEQIGRESFLDEVGTDHFTQVASHASVVGAATVGAGAKGVVLGPIRRAANAVRGTLLAFAVFARAATRRSATGFALVAVLLATGAAITGLRVFADADAPAALAVIGTALFWGGVVLVIVRSGFLAMSAVLLASLAVYLALRLFLLRDLPLRMTEPGGQALAIGVLVVALVVLGSVSLPGWPVGIARRWRQLTAATRVSTARTWWLVTLLMVSAWAVVAWYVLVRWPTLEPPPSGLGTPGDPGMVRAQLASSASDAARILQLWAGADYIEDARRQLRWDFGFLTALTVAVTVSVWRAGGVLGRAGADAGRFGREWAVAVPLAGLLDALENALLLGMISRADALSHPTRERIADELSVLPMITGLAATAKFVIFLVALMYLAGFGLWCTAAAARWTRSRGSRPSAQDAPTA